MNCIGAILAGGGSTRFAGAAKGLELVGGRRILDRVASALEQAADEIVLVSSAPEAASWLPGVRVVRDARDARGSLVGLHAALAGAGDGALVVAWDMPFASAALLRALREVGERTGAAVVPAGPHGPEPLCAYYPAAAARVAERQLERGEMRLGAMLEALDRVVTIPPEDVATFGDPAVLFMNVNDAAELATARTIEATAGR